MVSARRLFATATAGAATLLLAALAPLTNSDASSPPTGNFKAVSIISHHGDSAPFTDPGEVEVSISRGHLGQWIGWEANCNSFGAQFRVRRGRIQYHEGIVGSAVGCPGLWAKQDTWLSRFFETGRGVKGPRLAYRHRRLILSTSAWRIRFARIH